MGPRAACRLEMLGFRDVREFRAGKRDWLAAGLPTEGEAVPTDRLTSVMRTDVPTCRPDERVGDVAARVRSAGWDVCFATSDTRVVLGRLDRAQLDADPAARVEQVMKPGPSTYRADMRVGELLELMHGRHIRALPVTTSDGVLLGVVVHQPAS